MNKLIGLRALVLVILLSLLDCFFGCLKPRPVAEMQVYDCLKYRTYYVLKNGNTYSTLYKGDRVADTYISIEGVTESVHEREYFIVPEYINGIRVEQIHWLIGDDPQWENESIKKIYILAKFTNSVAKGRADKIGLYSYLNGEVFSMHNNKLIFTGAVYGTNKRFIPAYYFHEDYNARYTSAIEKGELDEFIEEYNKYYNGTNIYMYGRCRYDCYANTSFIYNYEDAPNNGYYFIDNYDYNSLITFIPPTPTREGYEFLGWYKEEKCINEWDFEVDTIGDPTGLDIDVFETKLYAKWGEANE